MSVPEVEALASPDLATPWVPIWPLTPPTPAISPIPVPVQLHTPRTSTLGGNAFWTAKALATWDSGHWEFVKDVEGRVYGQALLPWTFTTATLTLRLTTDGITGVSRMRAKVFDSPAKNPNDPATIWTDLGAVDVSMVGYWYIEARYTITPKPPGFSTLVFEIIHEGAHANDTLAANTWLVGAWLDLT